MEKKCSGLTKADHCYYQQKNQRETKIVQTDIPNDGEEWSREWVKDKKEKEAALVNTFL